MSPVQSIEPQPDSTSETFRYIDLSSVDQELKAIVSDRQVPAVEAPSRARQLVKTGDILVSTVRPNLNAVAVVPDRLHRAIASTGFCVLRPDSALLDNSYLFHWVRTQSFVGEMVRRATGASYPAVSDRIIHESTIPLPSLVEQRRIAAILDKADALRQKRRATLQKLDSLTQSLFLDMFGDPATNPKGLDEIELGEIAQFVGGGTPRREVEAFFDGPICWATSKDMKGEILEDTQEHITEEAIRSSATKLVEPGAVLVVVKSKVLMHRLPVLINRVPTCFGQDLKAIVLPSHWPARYVARHLRIDQKRLLDRARGINTEGLTLEHLREYKLLKPPCPERERWNSVEGLIEAQRHVSLSGLRVLDEQFSSLQYRAFRGEL